MKNRDIYLKDPSAWKLRNQGVATVNDAMTEEALSVLRYELETFVCEGQYARGMEHILQTYLDNLHLSQRSSGRGDSQQQPAVWISGFFGSGKSHFVKMMRALWVDTRFSDGATARSVTSLPESIRDLLKELSADGDRHGGLYAASGTLGAGASGSVRLALLSIIFRSAGLPESYPMANFVMWLRQEEIFDQVKKHVEANGHDWAEELDNLHVAEGLYNALCTVRPNTFSPSGAAAEIMTQLYPPMLDVSSEQMLKSIRKALSTDDKFPLTLVVLDEVQQFIGDDARRSDDVREAVEACCKSDFGSKLLFIGTGQTAVTGTANLKKQEGRFTVRVELSDADVDSVIRKVVLAKKPDAIPAIEQEMQRNLGEISRHLQGSSLAHTEEDVRDFSQDYPILPTRRRFWEEAQRVLDQTGVDGQLRNMLSMIHKVIQTNLDQSVPHAVPADYLYFDSADKLLQARVLPKKLHEQTMTWITGSADEKLLARACGLVFLINKLSGSNKEIGIRATVDTLADLLVEDLSQGSGAVRSRLPTLLDNCKLLMKIKDEYRIQTEESQAWADDFLRERGRLANESHRIDAERADRVKKRFSERIGKLTYQQGTAKVTRNFFPLFDASLPADADEKIYIWVRDGWAVDASTVKVEARQAGNHSPTVFVFIPKRSADDLRHQLLEFKAASATLETRGNPSTPEGKEAQAALETVKRNADGRIQELIDDCFSGAQVYQGGGNEIVGTDLQSAILEAATNSLTRLYPKFDVADHPGWAKVYSLASKGAPDALKAVGWDDEPAKNGVCKEILSLIAGGKTGGDIRSHFGAEDYGWHQDAIDGGLQVLLVAGLIRAQNEQGQVVGSRELDRRNIGRTVFKMEAATVSAPQRIQIRKVLQKAGLANIKQGEELARVPEFLQKMSDLLQSAGGESPMPELPRREFLEEIRLAQGNEQLLSIYNKREELTAAVDHWREIAAKIQERLPGWRSLQVLLEHARSLGDAEPFLAQAKQIEELRHLLRDPDPVAPLVNNLTQLLRDALNGLKKTYDSEWEKGFERLEQDANWKKLEPEQRHGLLLPQNLTEATRPKISVGSAAEIVETLRGVSLSALADRVAALPARFNQVLEDAAKLLTPKAVKVHLPPGTLHSAEEVEQWVSKVESLLKEKIQNGPIIV